MDTTHKCKDFFKPDGELIKQLLSRLLTRNIQDKIQRNADRLQFLQNVSNIAYNPAMHLGFCASLIDKYTTQGKPLTFEIGLVMGASMALCSCSRAHEKMLKQMLADIEKQQENEDGQENKLCGTDERTSFKDGKQNESSVTS